MSMVLNILGTALIMGAGWLLASHGDERGARLVGVILLMVILGVVGNLLHNLAFALEGI